MNVLVINCGSSSLKYRLFDMSKEAMLAKGLVERIGEAQGARYTHESSERRLSGNVDAPDHTAALRHMADRLIDPEHGPLASVDRVDAVGHRVVHGGEAFLEAAEITDEVIATVKEQASLAPLHNPSNLAGIRAARALFPAVPHVAVFDTAFHETMPPRAFLYGLPYEWYEKYHVRRYGFHGTSHRFVARRAAKMLGKPFFEFTGITCHLGNGCSMTAVRNGRSVDTSMGLTPLEGLIMGTRTGDLDPALSFYLAREAGIALKDLHVLYNTRSGLLGVSGLSNDVRTLLEAASEGHERARLALDMFAYRAKKYIGAYLAVLNGADAIVFTGGIGENAAPLREKMCSGLDRLGIRLDRDRNATTQSREAVISSPDSRIAVMVVPTNEELEIALETRDVVWKSVATRTGEARE